MAVNNVNNGGNNAPIDNQRLNQQTAASSQNAAQSARSQQAPQTAAPRQDSVSLTQSAQQLSQVQRRGSDAPVNQERVERLREAIANGEYRINPERLAQNIARVEAELFGNNS